MAHPEQRAFFASAKLRFPGHFRRANVLDCGSLDINGSLRDLFEECFYLGIDIHEGPNVNVICAAKDLMFYKAFETVVSGEMLEHSEFWQDDLVAMYKACDSGGLIAISCAGIGRPEHGTRRTGHEWNTSPDYYRNLSPGDIRTVYFEEMFDDCEFLEQPESCDTYFWGIRK